MNVELAEYCQRFLCHFGLFSVCVALDASQPNERFFSKSCGCKFFASNVLFWFESDYFAAAAEEKPLLHTWSLAVEEQFYIIFPVFLVLFWSFGKNRIFVMVAILATVSFLFSEWGWRNHSNANFYLAPFRAWELLAGVMAALIIQKSGVRENNLLATAGLVAIIISIFFFNKQTPFPSFYTLLPVLGTVLIVLFAECKTYVARLLSVKILVSLGLISYSAYLWHQPIFAFTRISMGQPQELLTCGLILFSFFSQHCRGNILNSLLGLKRVF